MAFCLNGFDLIIGYRPRRWCGRNHYAFACYCDQVGNQKQRFRDGYRLAVRLCCFVYPASKIVAYLLAGLASKNVRSRAECLDELCHIVTETGHRTVGRKGLQKIAALIATGEKDVRDTAIDVMEALWNQVRFALLALASMSVGNVGTTAVVKQF